MSTAGPEHRPGRLGYGPGAYVVVQNDGNACSKVRTRQRCRTGWNLRGTLGCIPPDVPAGSAPWRSRGSVRQQPADTPTAKDHAPPANPRASVVGQLGHGGRHCARPGAVAAETPRSRPRRPPAESLRNRCPVSQTGYGIHRTAHSRSLPMQHCGPHLPSLSSSAAGSSSDPARGSPPSSSSGPDDSPTTRRHRTRRLLRLTASGTTPRHPGTVWCSTLRS